MRVFSLFPFFFPPGASDDATTARSRRRKIKRFAAVLEFIHPGHSRCLYVIQPRVHEKDFYLVFIPRPIFKAMTQKVAHIQRSHTGFYRFPVMSRTVCGQGDCATRAKYPCQFGNGFGWFGTIPMTILENTISQVASGKGNLSTSPSWNEMTSSAYPFATLFSLHFSSMNLDMSTQRIFFAPFSSAIKERIPVPDPTSATSFSLQSVFCMSASDIFS